MGEQFPVQTTRNSRFIGKSALTTEVSDAIESHSFQVKSPAELLEKVLGNYDSLGNVLGEMTFPEQPGFSHTVHNELNKHFQEQHKSEWAKGIDHAIAPPLPLQWVSSRLDTYYKSVYKGDGDKVHANTIKVLRKEYLPYAEQMAQALPEISAAMEIKTILADGGNEVAADAVEDLLTVYGITIYYIREKQAKLRQIAKEKADRAAQALDNALLIQ